MPNPDGCVRHHHDGTVSQGLLKNRDVFQKNPCLNRRSAITHAKQNHRREPPAGTRQQCAEISILRDDHASLLDGPLEDNTVTGGAQPQFADMQNIVSRALQRLAHHPGNRLVEQESHVTNRSEPTG